MNWSTHLSQTLIERKKQQAYRYRIAHSGHAPLPFIDINGKRLLNFGGNDYLGLSRDESIITAWQQALAKYGLGSGGSPLVSGYTEAHARLENELATWLGYERALLFPSGFAANQALLLGLLGKNDVLLADKLCHASMQEAATLSPALFRRFAHQQYNVLAQQLAAQTNKRVLVATEGVFSMDGDCADLGRLKTLCETHNAWLLVDDAHGIGVLGTEGKGSAAAAGIHPNLLVITFGKAVGMMGAAILCNRDVAEYLTQFARHLIYSTAIPPAQAVALSAAFTRLRQADEQRAKLQHNIHYFQTALQQCGLAKHLLPSQTAIQPFICGSNQTALQAAQKLYQGGCHAPAIRPPTVPANQARLRLTLTAAHETSHIDHLIRELQHAI